MIAPLECLDVIVRLHSAKRLFELKRCLMSLIGQDYKCICVRLITQRFSPADMHEIEELTAELSSLNPSIKIVLHNFSRPEPLDARTELLNFGIMQAEGRFLAFLDYDDVIYPNMYSALIERLMLSQTSIAFCGVMAALADISQDAVMVRRKEARFSGSGLRGLFIDNHCPIHGLVIDKRAVDPKDLYFSPHLTRLEDYDFLLRLCTKYRSDFALKSRPMADYYLKSDQSNTVILGSKGQIQEEKRWSSAREKIAHLRKELVIAGPVREELNIKKKELHTVDTYLQSLSLAARKSLTHIEQTLLDRWYPFDLHHTQEKRGPSRMVKCVKTEKRLLMPERLV